MYKIGTRFKLKENCPQAYNYFSSIIIVSIIDKKEYMFYDYIIKETNLSKVKLKCTHDYISDAYYIITDMFSYHNYV